MILLNWKEWKISFFIHSLFIFILLYSTSSDHQYCILILLHLCSVLFLPFYYYLWQYLERMDGGSLSAGVKRVCVPSGMLESLPHVSVSVASHHLPPRQRIILRIKLHHQAIQTSPVFAQTQTHWQKTLLYCLKRLLSTTWLSSICSEHPCLLT